MHAVLYSYAHVPEQCPSPPPQRLQTELVAPPQRTMSSALDVPTRSGTPGSDSTRTQALSEKQQDHHDDQENKLSEPKKLEYQDGEGESAIPEDRKASEMARDLERC